ncbi:Smr/MutS family protein [Ancylobacter radicis]|uniref:Smr/MutS family protein n=1 Tax=Ancylobacter radicis TaxID=2836179 RepID=A0ABS5R732_9HYPH|nr:Smr/MutS family protein [Ancylobacter radicis]MBS9477471.1 Smr/MutS family protein [Ancylobacter radicis]
MTEGGGQTGGRPRRRRGLDLEERALWEHVARSVNPLRPKLPVTAPPAPVPEPAEPEAKSPAPTRPAAAPSVKAKPPGPPPLAPLAPLEPKLRRRLGRGAEVDARLDLHGLTQAAAHGRLNAFLRGAQGAGHSLVLVITGKGEGMRVLAGEGGRGVLRRLVPQWLAAPELRGVVVGFETAARGHGGEGALYVRIRRAREIGR